jgi:hypothetical protein
MNRATIPVKLPPSLGNAARKLAEEDGVSLNQWVSLAVAQKISSVETAEAFFKRRVAHISILRCGRRGTSIAVQALDKSSG